MDAIAVEIQPVTVAGHGGPLDARLFRSARLGRAPADALMVFFHGGGFTSGSLAAAEACLSDMAAHFDAVLLAPAYAQACDEPFPAAAEDAYAVLADCVAHPARYRWTGKALVVAGVEAGGNLAAVASLMARDRGGPRIAGQLLITPMLDPGLTTCSMRTADLDRDSGRIASFCAEGYREYLPRAADRMHPYASPLAASRLRDLPPTLMVLIDGDPLRDEGDSYVRKLQAAGVAVDTLLLSMPPETGMTTDADTRCRIAADPGAFAAMAAFVAAVVRVTPRCTARSREAALPLPSSTGAKNP